MMTVGLVPWIATFLSSGPKGSPTVRLNAQTAMQPSDDDHRRQHRAPWSDDSGHSKRRLRRCGQEE